MKNASLLFQKSLDSPPVTSKVRRVPLKDDSEAESSFARMSKRFSRSLKNLMQMDGNRFRAPTWFLGTFFRMSYKLHLDTTNGPQSPLGAMRRARSINKLYWFLVRSTFPGYWLAPTIFHRFLLPKTNLILVSWRWPPREKTTSPRAKN